jgi:cyclophilin family peptidyl-prolyl cis-trans isomerase
VQGKFWEMHDLLFERQSEWSPASEGEARKLFEGYASDVGLDVQAFSRALEEGTYSEAVNASLQEAMTLGLRGTPTWFVNGQLYNGPREEYALAGLSKLFSYDGPQWDAPPEMSIDPDRPYFAVVESTKGTFCLELYTEQAPKTVNSFVFLAEQGFYNGVDFHRVLPGFVAQTGDPTGSGFGGPGYRFEDEIDPELKHDSPGLLSMANAGPGTNGSQFFITYDALPQLDGKHAIFGQVVEGMDVVESLMPRNPQQDPYAPADKMVQVTIQEACSN